jgi:hypothetical protein
MGGFRRLPPRRQRNFVTFLRKSYQLKDKNLSLPQQNRKNTQIMETSRIYPLLSLPATASAGVDVPFHIPFFSAETESDFPVITFVEWAEGAKTPITSPQEVNMTGGELVQAALRNIGQTLLSWQPEAAAGMAVLVAKGHDFAAEKILDKGFIAQAAQQLGSAKICIAIPCRGVMLAATPDQRELLETAMTAYLLDFSRQPISEMIFLIEDGLITNFFRATPRRKGAEQAEAPTDLPAGLSHTISEIPLLNDRYHLTVLLGAPDAETLMMGIQHIALSAFERHASRKDFLGQIDFQTIAGQPKASAELTTQLSDFFMRHPALQGCARRFGDSMRMSFLHGADYQAGNFHLRQSFEISR